MRQYLDAKRQHGDAIVFFRMGDFYEMFYEDALTASRALDLTLTSRSKDAAGGSIPMCGVPYHAVDGYIARLVRKGFRVAICEQVEDPRKARGVVRREVVRVVSPGTLTDSAYLDAKEPAFLLSLAVIGAGASPGRAVADLGHDPVGVALLDLSTGEFASSEYVGSAGLQALDDEICVLRPREVLAPAGLDVPALLPGVARLGLTVTTAEPWTFDPERARRTLTEQFRTEGLEGFGLEGHRAPISAAGGLLHHVRETQKADLAHVRSLTYRPPSDALVLDATTLRHLEILEAADGSRPGSLLAEIDCTVTAMGGRRLRAWLLRPLVALERIQDRLDAVEELAFRSTERAKLREVLKGISDLERLVARAALGTAGPRDLVALKASLTAIPRVRTLVQDLEAPLIASLLAELDDLTDVRDWIDETIAADPPAVARDGGAIRERVDGELDELRDLSRSTRRHIAEMEAHERARTGIASLKVRYNRVFGYYIEVSRANLRSVPTDYQRKQTIAGGERFVTSELKAHEEKVLGADERILERELEIFEELRARVAGEAPRVQDSARALAGLDALAGLAEVAALRSYVKPQLHEGDELVLVEARHPVVERHTRGAFVPNDLALDAGRHLVILTGPNMGGKSTYLRQTALMSILAQAGSFVPAQRAKLPIVDRVFARVGAADNIARGQSTFMVEMQETANILHSATSRSLVLLDEIGRGTATYDGLSIAWAVAEYLATNARARPKTLFATHYHELTDLADAQAGVLNLHVVAREWQDEIVFLRKVAPGRSDRSYGIQVARLAGLPPSVVSRAQEILTSLEQDELTRGGRPSLSGPSSASAGPQLTLFEAPSTADSRVARRLEAADTDRMTPLDALAFLAALKRELKP
jgi:DNA mismatch repair protein MutS